MQRWLRLGRLEAVPTPLEDAAWRLEVGRFRAAERRRTFRVRVYVGVPAGVRVDLESPRTSQLDRGLRFDLLTALLDRWRRKEGDRPAYAWLSRQGRPEPHDEDLAWRAAAADAFEAHEVSRLGFRAVTKTGWLDPDSGERQEWVRLRLDR